MSLWDRILSLFQTAEETTEEAVEDKQSVEELFRQICAEHGIGRKVLNSVQGAEKFEAWYEGPCDRESILASLAEFKLQHPGVSAKLTSIGRL